MSLVDDVTARLEGLVVQEWERELILVMARSLEETPNASMVQQLQRAMDAAGASRPLVAERDPVDELRRRREERERERGIDGKGRASGS